MTVIYMILFYFIRVQSRRLRNASISQEMSTNEDGTWHCDVASDDIEHPPNTNQTFSMKTVIIRREVVPQKSQPQSAPQRRLSRASWVLLCYPLIYSVLVFPLAVARLMAFKGKLWSLTAIYVGGVLFDCQGWVNAILYTATRQGILSWDRIFHKRKSNRGNDSSKSTLDSQSRHPFDLSPSSIPENAMTKMQSEISPESVERYSSNTSAK